MKDLFLSLIVLITFVMTAMANEPAKRNVATAKNNSNFESRFSDDLKQTANSEARMDKWFRDAKFGAFIHFGDYQMYKKPGRAITVSGFQTKGQALSWDFKLYKPGTYEIVIDGGGTGNQNGGEAGKLRAHVAGQSIETSLTSQNFGTVQIDAPGTYTFTLEVASAFRNASSYGSVTLVPVSQDK